MKHSVYLGVGDRAHGHTVTKHNKMIATPGLRPLSSQTVLVQRFEIRALDDFVYHTVWKWCKETGALNLDSERLRCGPPPTFARGPCHQADALELSLQVGCGQAAQPEPPVM
eukprot:4468417-Amphidinium_carterae.1